MRKPSLFKRNIQINANLDGVKVLMTLGERTDDDCTVPRGICRPPRALGSGMLRSRPEEGRRGLMRARHKNFSLALPEPRDCLGSPPHRRASNRRLLQGPLTQVRTTSLRPAK